MIKWSKSRQLSSPDYDQLRELFEEGLILCATEEIQGNLFTSPEDSLVTSCLSLYQNLVLFELAYVGIDVALALLQHLVSVCPGVPELWALYARYVCDSCVCTCMYVYEGERGGGERGQRERERERERMH